MTQQERDALIEECARAAEQQDRAGREWVPESLWAKILTRAGAEVRRLKSIPVQDATPLTHVGASNAEMARLNRGRKSSDRGQYNS